MWFYSRGAAAGGDARDKLIISRRAIGDARAVIGQHVVEKVGDLRTMLAPKRGISRGRGVRGRGRGGGRFVLLVISNDNLPPVALVHTGFKISLNFNNRQMNTEPHSDTVCYVRVSCS